MKRAARYLGFLLALSPLGVAHADLLPEQGYSDQLAEVTPRYLIEAIEIRGNHKTRSDVIRRALVVHPGERLAIDDPRFELSRYRVISLGFFSDVQLRLRRGSARGSVVLVLEVTERGTIILTDLFLGTSEATNAWGGLGLAERNFLGRGLGLEAAFVLGTDPDVARAKLQQSYWVGLSAPRFARGALELNGGALFVDGSEFFRRAGSDHSSDPDDFISSRYRRVGGVLGAGFNVAHLTRMRVDYRGEAVSADIAAGATRQRADGRSEAIDFDIIDGDSLLSLISVTLERDTRSDPFMPEEGSLLTIVGDVATRLLGSSYNYVKLTASYRHFFPLRWRHIVALQLFGGALFGEAPFFEKFFIGDLNDLVPSRSLGLNFSTLPSRDLFGTSIDSKRYEEIALRVGGEYIIPWFRGSGFAYAGDLFVGAGVIFLASKEDLQFRDRALSEVIPVDLTLDAGLRLDTRIGVFHLSIGNGLGRIPF